MLEHTAARHQPSYLSFVNLIGTINTRILNMATTALIIWNGEREGVRERERARPFRPPACLLARERARGKMARRLADFTCQPWSAGS